MENISFDKMPQHFELMKSLIKDQTIQRIYSKFEFLYYPFSNIYSNENNDTLCQKIDSFQEFLLHYLLNYKFITCCYKNKEKARMDSKSEPQLKDFIICVENKCMIIADIDKKIIDLIIDNLHCYQIKLLNIDSDSKETKEEIKNFSKHFSVEIHNNEFLKLTFKTIACFMIRRFYCPTDYFNDHSFFMFPECNKIKKDYEIIKDSIEQYFHSENELLSSFYYWIHSPRDYINFYSRSIKQEYPENKYVSTPFGDIPVEGFELVPKEESEEIIRDVDHMIRTLTDPLYLNANSDEYEDSNDEIESQNENQKNSESNYEITPFGNIVFDDENDDFDDDDQSSTSDEDNYQRKKNFESSSSSDDSENYDNSCVHQDFFENDFIILRRLYQNDEAIFYMVFHIKSFYIFVMKKIFHVNEMDNQINHEIFFCENYSHRCFTQFYGFLKENDKIVGFIYEFMSNDSLNSFVNSHEDEIDEIYILMTINRIVQGIEYLHSNSLIYRDLKPKNILIDHDFIPYISDFETIRHPFDDTPNVDFTGNIGTFYYSSPEQDKNINISYPTDIYSFGLTVYFLYEKKDMRSLINSNLEKRQNDEILLINNCSETMQKLYKKCVKYNQFERPKINEIKEIIIGIINSTNIILDYITNEDIDFNKSNLVKFISERLFLQLDEVPQLHDTHEMLKKIRYIVIGRIIEDDLLFYSSLGNYYYDIELYEEARKCFEKKANLMNPVDLYKLGRIYYEGLNVQQDFTKAKQYFIISAERGNANSLLILGLFYMNGISVDQDYNKAREYFEKAVEKEKGDAYLFLGDLYLYGYGVPCDYRRAKRYYEVYLNKQNFYGNYKIGKLYENGLGVKKNYLKAKEYYERAYNSDAFISLGHFYKNGYGVKKNYKKVRMYYEKASNMNNSYAFNCLGELYEKGLGVTRNYLTAHYYYKLAAKLNNPEALFYLGYYYSTDNVDISKAIEYYMKCHEKQI